MDRHPLIVDLDGTLVHTDTLHESTLRLVKDSPLNLLRIPAWLFQGKATLKKNLADLTHLAPETLPYNTQLLGWLKEQRSEGRELVLCTAADLSIANSIAAHLGIFDKVLASNGAHNLSGENKAKALVELYGEQGFDYAGNATADLKVWQVARKALVVGGRSGLLKAAEQHCEQTEEFPSTPANITDFIRVLRVHQWLKNLLLFIPLLAAHQITNAENWLAVSLAFIAFCLCASSVYIANDLLDLESDRQHPRKRSRPFASGIVPIWVGTILSPILLACSLAIAQYVGGNFLPWLAAYFALTCAYTWKLKRLVIVDCLALAMLYTLRIVAGGAAVVMSLSFWLLAFSIFLFLSLAFVKRYAELEAQGRSGVTQTHGRDYFTSDAPLIQSMGITSGYAAVVVLALYLNSDAIQKLYTAPEFVWGAVPIMLFWVSWIWTQAHRGNMHDDPLVFAIKDKASLLSGLLFAAVTVLGTIGWQW